MTLEHQPLGCAQRTRLAEDLLRDRELADVVQASGEAEQLHLVGVQLHARADAGRQLADLGGVLAGVGVARIDRAGQSGGREEARVPVVSAREQVEVADLGRAWPVDARAALAPVLRGVERAVRDADKLAAVEPVVREDGDAGRHGQSFSVLELHRRDAVDDRSRDGQRLALGAPGQEQRKLVAAQPERLAPLPQSRRDLREHVVSDGMTVPVVHAFEIVDVHEAEREPRAALLRPVEVVLEPLVEVTVVPEARQRVGERQAHRAERVVHRALVQRHGDERADERDREERGVGPQLGQDQRDRRHDRERDRRAAQRAPDERGHRLVRRPGDDDADQRDVRDVEGGRAGAHGEEERQDALARLEAERCDTGGRSPGRGGPDHVDRAVVEELVEPAPLDELDDDEGDEGDEHRRRPAVDDRRADDEDRGERHAPGRDALEVDRDGEELGEHRPDDEQADAGPVVQRESERRQRRGGRDEHDEPDRRHGHENPENARGRGPGSGQADRAQPFGRVPARTAIHPRWRLCYSCHVQPAPTALTNTSAVIRPKRSLLFQCSMFPPSKTAMACQYPAETDP